MGEIHPAPDTFSAEQIAADPVLHYFHFAHLPPALQAVSARFCGLAHFIVINLPRNAERSVALRKLLEAKDAAVRANVPAPMPVAPAQTFADRLLVEHGDLADKINKLNAFFDTAVFEGLDRDQRELLQYQHVHMNFYIGALEERMKLLGIDLPPATARTPEGEASPAAFHESRAAMAECVEPPKGEILDGEDGDIVEVRTTRHADENPIAFDD